MLYLLFTFSVTFLSIIDIDHCYVCDVIALVSVLN